MLTLVTSASIAQGLQLDPAFGGTGKVLTALATPASSSDTFLDMEALPNNRLLVLAQGQAGLVKLLYNADGTLDTSYGTAGRLQLAALPTGFSVTQPQSISRYRDLLPNGRVVIVGMTGSANALAAYNADGTIDTGFGSSGVATLNYVIGSFAVQPDGKILVGGSADVQTQVGTFSGGEMKITRLQANGALEFTTTLTPPAPGSGYLRRPPGHHSSSGSGATA